MRLQLTIIYCLLLLATQCAKPRSKRQHGVWRAECELGIISDPNCPIDGGWSPWGPWSPCQGPCDDIGHRRRTRECNNPTTSKDGIPCSGPDEQIETCYITNCTVADYRALIEGDFARTSALKQLEALPALLERCLQMDCHYDAIESALSRDNTWQLNTEAIWNALQCVKFNIGCPVAGGWSSWGVWSACGARCGWGRQWRLRRCDNPPPSAANLICDGSPLQANVCEGLQCSLGEFGTWGAWGPWSGCSEPCGNGVRRRRRVCSVKQTPNPAGMWGTPCIGQHDELDICENNTCVLNGGWSGWGPWSACSQSCGAGRRARSRSCTRPIPNDDGKPCVGLHTEIGSCHLAPCQVYLHTVAMLNGESFIHFNFENKRSTFFHFFIRFKPLSPHGTLVRRGDLHNPLIRMSLQNWHVCVDANGQAKSCSLERICAPTALEADVWHSVLVTVTTESVILRIDDALFPIKGTFLCDPELPDAKMKVWIGEKLHGEIQEIILNFIPLKLKTKHERRKASSFYPYSASNIIYDKSTLEEAFLTLTDDQYLRLPCFVEQEEWQVELTFKPKNNVGTLLYLENEYQKNWLVVSLHNMRLKLRLALGEYRSESTTSTDYLPDQWIDVTLSKKKETNTVEALINGKEKLHVMIGVDNRTQLAYFNTTRKVRQDAITRPQTKNSKNVFHICSNEFYVGGIPEDATSSLKEDFTPFSGVLASLSINKVFLDLHDFSVERTKDNKVQVSSRTASVSGLYHETGWGKSNRLNLTCLHARTLRSPYFAHWLYLDTGIRSVINDKTVRSVDDGRVLRLDASADNDLRGFYTCRALTNGRTRNIVTYGILGKIRYQLSSPDMVTAVALFTTITLVIVALATLVMEGINDLRNGYGFFRDRHLSPQEECDCVCNYIEENADFFGSESAIKCAKAKAQKKTKEIISRMNFGAQEPEGITEVRKRLGKCILESSSDNAVDMTSAKGSIVDPGNQYKCDQSYVSSPRHGSEISAQSGRKITSTTCSVALSLSPRVICSKLLLSKKLLYSSSKESLVSKAKNKGTSNLQSKCKLSPGQKVLQRFRELNNDDY